MNVEIQSVKFDADKKLLDFIEQKLEKIDKFADGAISSDVILRIDKDHEHGNKVAVITIDVPGAKLVAEKQSKSFEEAVDHCIDAIKKQLDKHKGTM